MTTITVVALTLCVLASLTSNTIAAKADPRVEKASKFYNQGIIASKSGNYELAKTSFREVLKIYPTHPQAKRQLIYLTNNKKSLNVNKRKGALHQVILPKIDIDKSNLQEALEILSAHIAQASSNKVKPNIIVQDPAHKFSGRTVTLNLNNIPADALLGYILDQTSGIARFDAHAIVVSPRQQTVK